MQHVRKTDKQMSKILIFDNYDSFTYNLVHAVKSLGYKEVDVIRNDKIDLTRWRNTTRSSSRRGRGFQKRRGCCSR